MEIERKWLVQGYPEGLEQIEVTAMAQGYLATNPTVRLRKEARVGGDTAYVLCFKSGAGLVRKEIEMPLAQEIFEELAAKILVKPLIPKQRRDYALPGGFTLEVNHVDAGQPTAFFYAEIEFESEAQATAWCAPTPELATYLTQEVTHEKGQSMAAYWNATRGID